MKTKLLTLAVFVFTLSAVWMYPSLNGLSAAVHAPNQAPTSPVVAPNPNQHPKIDVVFVLDTTGSMGGLIQTAKEKIWSIASSMAQARPAPEIRIGLVAYRDRGDAYVTRVVDLSSDLDSVYATLMDFKAEGGGDGPESVNAAVYDAIHKISWSQDSGTYKVVFLVGDAPAHMDYQDDVKYTATLDVAKQRGIVVNAIQCGGETLTQSEWRSIAQLGNGSYFQVSQAGDAVAVATPYDKKLAELSAKLDKTRLSYGSDAEKAKEKAKQDATDKLHAESSVESRARRASFNASPSGATNQLGTKDLVEDVSKGRVDLSKLAPAALPAPMQSMAPAEQKALVEDTIKQRDMLNKEIDALAAQRAEHLKKEVEKSGGAKASLDQKIYGAIREQAEKKGFKYENAEPEY